MNTIVYDRVKMLELQIEETKALDEDVELVLRLMPDANIWLDNEVNVDWAVKGLNDVKEVLRKFAKEGILLDTFIESQTNPIWYLRGIYGKIRLNPTWAREAEEGVTCRLIKVGESTSTYPIYNLVCRDKDGKESPVKEALYE